MISAVEKRRGSGSGMTTPSQPSRLKAILPETSSFTSLASKKEESVQAPVWFLIFARFFTRPTLSYKQPGSSLRTTTTYDDATSASGLCVFFRTQKNAERQESKDFYHFYNDHTTTGASFSIRTCFSLFIFNLTFTFISCLFLLLLLSFTFVFVFYTPLQ